MATHVLAECPICLLTSCRGHEGYDTAPARCVCDRPLLIDGVCLKCGRVPADDSRLRGGTGPLRARSCRARAPGFPQKERDESART